ncbi:MAG: hypothetical protein JW919_01635 [Candidatus Omnitrophica bacterium]|nr:hypothetical protein [Candidatus Omnitrophota bacterium]
MGPENNIDREESLKKILSDYEAREESKARQKEKARRSEALAGGASFALRALLFAAGVGAVIFFSVRFMQGSGVFEKKVYWAIGRRFVTDNKIEECIGRLWDIRKAMDNYYAKYKTFPVSMEELYRDRKDAKPYTCPATGEAYIMKEAGGRKIFCCPDPKKHAGDVSEIWCDVRGGPPAIERYQSY